MRFEGSCEQLGHQLASQIHSFDAEMVSVILLLVVQIGKQQLASHVGDEVSFGSAVHVFSSDMRQDLMQQIVPSVDFICLL